MPRIVDAGIDYIAATLHRDVLRPELWSASAVLAMDLIRDAGNVTRPGSFNGYSGIYCGGAFYGEREDSYHIHIPGAWAGVLWQQLHDDRLHYSRFDVQVTYQYDDDDLCRGEVFFQKAASFNRLRPVKQQRKIRRIEDDGYGVTVYVGSRKSKHFARLYDKGAQTGDEAYERAWRYEVELHNDSATASARYIWNRTAAVAKVTSSTVWSYFHERGITPPWTKEDEETALRPATTPKTDIERKLQWLREQVAPTVRLLHKSVPAPIIRAALGMDEDDQLPPEFELSE